MEASETIVEVEVGVVVRVVVGEGLDVGGATGTEVEDDDTVEGDGFTVVVEFGRVVVGGSEVDVVVGGSGSVVVVLDNVGELVVDGSVVGGSVFIVVVVVHNPIVVVVDAGLPLKVSSYCKFHPLPVRHTSG